MVVGSAEADAGTVSLKNLISGEQVTVSVEEAAAIIQNSTDLSAKPVKGS